MHTKNVFYAKTIADLEAVKNTLDVDVRDYLSQVPDRMQFPAAAKYLRGKKGSSTVESGNRAIMDSREAPFVNSSLTLANNFKKRFETQKQLAHSHRDTLAPRMQQSNIQDLRRVYLFGSNMVSISLCKSYATVKSVRCPGREYAIIFKSIKDSNEKSFRGFCSLSTGYPCVHQLAAVKVLGENIVDYLHPKDTVKTWKSIYEFNMTIRLSLRK